MKFQEISGMQTLGEIVVLADIPDANMQSELYGLKSYIY